MKWKDDFCKQCLENAAHLRDVVPVYRLREQTIEEMEQHAHDLAERFVGEKEVKHDLQRADGQSDFFLPEGKRARVFHASGAFTATSGLGPLENLLAKDIERVEKDNLIVQSDRALKRLELDRLCGREERLKFERLWQIKAAGVSKQGERTPVALCRSVGAYRRYLHDLPVWGRASVHLTIAGDDQLDGLGIDWRTVKEEPLDQARIIDPTDGARLVLAHFQSRLPGSEITREHFTVKMFALGYFSLPRRRTQGTMAPAYVAMIESNESPGAGHLIVVPASETIYESFCVPEQTPLRFENMRVPKFQQYKSLSTPIGGKSTPET